MEMFLLMALVVLAIFNAVVGIIRDSPWNFFVAGCLAGVFIFDLYAFGYIGA